MTEKELESLSKAVAILDKMHGATRIDYLILSVRDASDLINSVIVSAEPTEERGGDWHNCDYCGGVVFEESRPCES